jgi:hypothetical protein
VTAWEHNQRQILEGSKPCEVCGAPDIACDGHEPPVCPYHGIATFWETTLVAPHWDCRLCLEPTYNDEEL